MQEHNIICACPAGHPLLPYKTTSDQWVCDTCEAIQPGTIVPDKTSMYGCRPCGYDLCNKCCGQSKKFNEVVIIAAMASGREFEPVVMDPRNTAEVAKNLLEEIVDTPKASQSLVHEGKYLNDRDVIEPLVATDPKSGRKTLRVLLIKEPPIPKLEELGAPEVMERRRERYLRYALLDQCRHSDCDALTVRYTLWYSCHVARNPDRADGHSIYMRFQREDDANGDPLLRKLANAEYSALITAASQGHRDACEEFMVNQDYAQPLNSTSRDGATDLHIAVKFGFVYPNVPLVEMLLNGTNFKQNNAKMANGKSGMDIAVDNIFSALEENKERFYTIASILYKHADYDNRGIYEEPELEQDDLKPSPADCPPVAPLFLAAYHADFRLLDIYLPQEKTRTKLKDRFGRTLVHLACANPDMTADKAIALVEKVDGFVDFRQKDRWHRTACRCLEERGFLEIEPKRTNTKAFKTFEDLTRRRAEEKKRQHAEEDEARHNEAETRQREKEACCAEKSTNEPRTGSSSGGDQSTNDEPGSAGSASTRYSEGGDVQRDDDESEDEFECCEYCEG